VITVLLVDTQLAVRQGLRMELALEPDIVVIGEAESGEEALALAAQLRPDVVIMDIALPETDGIATISSLRAIVAQSLVVILSFTDDPKTRARALSAGAIAFVGKQEPSETLLTMIRHAVVQWAGRHSFDAT